MASAWIEHVKQWAKTHGKSYACAISDPACKKAYSGGKEKPAKEPKSPLKGRVMKKKYLAGEEAKDAMLAFKSAKKARAKPATDVGISPSQVVGDMMKQFRFNM